MVNLKNKNYRILYSSAIKTLKKGINLRKYSYLMKEDIKNKSKLFKIKIEILLIFLN